MVRLKRPLLYFSSLSSLEAGGFLKPPYRAPKHLIYITPRWPLPGFAGTSPDSQEV